MSIPDRLRQAGISLVELIMYIVIVGIAVGGIATVINVTVKSSGDPAVRKQALAIAEGLLEEIELMPFTYCDTDDTNVASATSATVGVGGCAAYVEALGPETISLVTEDRYASPRFDNVNDYDGFTMSGTIKDITNTTVDGLGAYTATVTITQVGTVFGLANETALRIDVTVTSTNTNITVTGYRFRYAPNSI